MIGCRSGRLPFEPGRTKKNDDHLLVIVGF